MKLKALSIYPKFKCIADKCQHSCCLGWEIDIDPKTREIYKNLNHSYAKVINNNIDDLPEPHFRLCENDRCPFLRDDNLCDMILNIGEEYLCDICRDHPRYRNYDEIGLGICCEEAARQLIYEKSPITVIELDIDDDVDTSYEFPYHKYRDEFIDILNSKDSLLNKIKLIEYIADSDLTPPNLTVIKSKLHSLERLDSEWDKYINSLLDGIHIKPDSYSRNSRTDFFNEDLSTEETKMFSNILIYFIHRYLPQSFDMDSLGMFLRFSVLSVYIIGTMYLNNKRQIPTLVEICRLYSSEIEYSMENIENMLTL